MFKPILTDPQLMTRIPIINRTLKQNFHLFNYNPLILYRIVKCVDLRIILIGIAIAIVLSGGTGVMAASNSTGNKSDIGTAQQLEQLTSNNSLANASSMTSFNNTTNQTGNQTGNQSSSSATPGQPGYTPPG
jgi:hypothetical protein